MVDGVHTGTSGEALVAPAATGNAIIIAIIPAQILIRIPTRPSMCFMFSL
jgi:hypothetical protein